MAHCHQIIRQPGHQQIPVIIETEKAQTDADQIPVSNEGKETFDEGLKTEVNLARNPGAKLSGCDPQPRNEPNQREETDHHECALPSVMNQQPWNQDSLQHQSGTRSEVEESTRQPAR